MLGRLGELKSALGAFTEAARLNPATTKDELRDWKDLLELINTGSL